MLSGLKWWLVIGGIGVIWFMIVNRSITKPLKWIGYGALYSIVGAIVLFLINLVGEYIDIKIPINLITSLIVGGLGLPGLVSLIMVKCFIIG
jgi:inhibitor of the pro-sigma K processing machinery